MSLQTDISRLAPATAGRRGKAPEAETPLPPKEDAKEDTGVVTFTSGTGKVYEIPDLPENLGRATALAAEHTLAKIWGTAQEDEACQDTFGGR